MSDRPLVTSQRCVRIAVGFPYLEMPDPSFLASAETDRLFEGRWKPQEAAHYSSCSKAFGPGWELPTTEQARALLKPRVVPWIGIRAAMLARDRTHRIVTVSVEAIGALCAYPDPRCKWHQRWTESTSAPGDLYCVAPPEQALSPEPGDAEIIRCVRDVNRTIDEGQNPMPIAVLDPAASGFVLAARKACSSQRRADFDAFADLLRAELASSTVFDRSREIDRALGLAENGARTAREALIAADRLLSWDCDRFTDVYRYKCRGVAHMSDCITWQAQYAAECLSSDPSTTLSALAAELEAKASELGPRAHRQRTIERASLFVANCAKDQTTEFGLRELLGQRVVARPDPVGCECSVADLECALAPFRGSPCTAVAPPPPAPANPCGCAPSDLQCNMRCRN